MAGIPSEGDIFKLSQVAWKISRAFMTCRNGAPKDFLEIETEVNDLGTSLKLLVEALYHGGAGGAGVGEGLLAQADRRTRASVASILQGCDRTLQDLDDLVQRYQDIRTYRTSEGTTIRDRSWSELVLRNYATMMWTADAGSIGDLKELLHVHASTIALTTQALKR